MTLKLTYKSEGTLNVNIDECVKDYKRLHADGSDCTVEEYVDDFWAGLDDPIYYCDNNEELQTEICNAMKQQLADGNK
jgi:hypothetical protein